MPVPQHQPSGQANNTEDNIRANAEPPSVILRISTDRREQHVRGRRLEAAALGRLVLFHPWWRSVQGRGGLMAVQGRVGDRVVWWYQKRSA